MVDTSELEQYLLDRDVTLDLRIKRLLTSQGVKVATLAYLGEVLRDDITPEERRRYKLPVERLLRSIELWRSRINVDN